MNNFNDNNWDLVDAAVGQPEKASLPNFRFAAAGFLRPTSIAKTKSNASPINLPPN
jgi:hypothetical protein